MNHGSDSWMAYEDLNSFIDALRKDNDLLEIDEEISPHFDMGAILKVIGEREGTAVLFKRVAGFPGKAVVGNVMGHRRRVAKALGVDEAELRDAYLKRKRERWSNFPVPSNREKRNKNVLSGPFVSVCSDKCTLLEQRSTCLRSHLTTHLHGAEGFPTPK